MVPGMHRDDADCLHTQKCITRRRGETVSVALESRSPVSVHVSRRLPVGPGMGGTIDTAS